MDTVNSYRVAIFEDVNIIELISIILIYIVSVVYSHEMFCNINATNYIK